MFRVKQANNLYFFGAADIPLKIKQKYGLDADAIEIFLTFNIFPKQVEHAAEEASEDRFVEELRIEIERQSDKSADSNETNGDEISI
ncbi:hypothetical protein [Parasitella parasitica]|uniref:Uncharacterized protein n=1 Tax=Parasitella parasitica TaxID=35722 RepID=A0A0B7NEE1_9FUNG|nr:hypothetical protein [Parasitella parasitica]